MKVYVTKYALTEGIQAFDAEPSSTSPNMVRVGAGYFHGEGREWHKTLEGAQKKAEEMRLAKIKSLKKSIAKLEALKW